VESGFSKTRRACWNLDQGAMLRYRSLI